MRDTSAQASLSPRWGLLLLILVILAGLPVRLAAAQNMPWDMDYVPVIALGQRLLDGGPFPMYGTLSSVAAYNMPMLVWLHIPALTLTRDPSQTILLTELTINTLGIIYSYLLGSALFDRRVGLAAAILFSFSEVGISAAYTAWAQLLLPSFTVAVMYYLWLWRLQEKGRYLALSGIIATAAFMTHFAAVMLYPAMLVWALLTRARWQWHGLAAGIVVCVIMFAPYLAFQVNRDFVDLRAFFSRDENVPAEVLELARQFSDGATRPALETTPEAQPIPDPAPEAQHASSPTPPPSRIERALNFALSIPGQIVSAFSLIFSTSPRALETTAPALYLLKNAIDALLGIIFAAVSVIALLWTLRQTARRTRSMHGIGSTLAQVLVDTPLGRAAGVFIFLGVTAFGLILTRAQPVDQSAYYMSLFAVQWVLTAFGLVWLLDWLRAQRTLRLVLISALLITFAGIATVDRFARLSAHDDDAFSRYNVSLYRHIADAAAYIAADSKDDALGISYDVLPEMGNLWWVLAWNTVDPAYRIGAPMDYLLSSLHGISNENQAADGIAPNADYVVVYTPGLSRYELADYNVTRFGAIHVLKPNQP